MPTLVTCFLLLSLSRLFTLVLSHPKLKSLEVSVSPRVGSFRGELSLCLALFPIFNLGLIHDSGYFHSPLIHLLKISIGVPYYHLLYFPTQSLLEVVHSHFFSGHLVWCETAQFIKLDRVFHHTHFSLFQAYELLFLSPPSILGIVLSIY